MSHARRRLLPLALLAAAAILPGQEKSRAVEHTLESHEQSLYFTIPPKQEAKEHPLLVVLPGGPGTRAFLPWVENGILGAAPPETVGVMVTAVKWREDQKIVWPTAKAKVKGMRYTTEDYVLAVLAAVQKEHAIDRDRIALLVWSSSGPAAWRLMADKKAPFSRAYVAMSVWRPLSKVELRATRKRRFVIDQSPDDEVTTFPHAARAYEALTGARATVRLSTYEGGHGWKDAPIPRLRTNLAWLFGDEPAPAPEWPGGDEKGEKRRGR